ncbi:Uncharacterised protein [Mycobacterium tuberculosis]|nr:Uncharacterised protein [Mycobacterium tuberculosis]
MSGRDGGIGMVGGVDTEQVCHVLGVRFRAGTVLDGGGERIAGFAVTHLTRGVAALQQRTGDLAGQSADAAGIDHIDDGGWVRFGGRGGLRRWRRAAKCRRYLGPDRGRVDNVDILAVDVVVAHHGQRPEFDVTARQVAHPAEQVLVPAGRQHHIFACHGHQVVEPVQVGEGARILKFAHDRRQECLLAVGAVQVPVV